MRNKTFHDLLWALIEPEIEDEKRKSSPSVSLEEFFKVPGHCYLDTILNEENKKVQYNTEAVKLLESTQIQEYIEAFNKNKSFYDKIYYFNLEPTSLRKNPLSFRQHRFRISGHDLESFINSLTDYILPRVTFHPDPKKEFTRLFELFESDFLSDDGTLEYYVFLENYHSHSNYHLEVDENTETRGFNCFAGIRFDYFESVHDRCRFFELKNWLKGCHPQIKIPDNSFYCAIKRVKINKKTGDGFVNPYEFARKIMLSLRLIEGGSVYFKAIGIKALYFSPPFELSDIRSFPGNEISTDSILSTDLEQHHAETFKELWPYMEAADYEKLHIPDLKLEISLKRTGFFGPEGRSELNTFNDVDRVLDLFQGIESLIAAPTLIDRGDLALGTLTSQKRQYIPKILSKVVHPNDLTKQAKLEDFIGRLWDLRNEYAHGDLINLSNNALSKTFQKELSDNVRLLWAIFREACKRLIVNYQIIPFLPDTSGKRDRNKLIEFWENRLVLDLTCAYKFYYP